VERCVYSTAAIGRDSMTEEDAMSNRGSQVVDRKAREREEWNGCRPYKLFQALRAQPAIGDALCAQGAVLMDEVDHRTRELVALRVSAVRNCDYVWAGHARFAKELALTCDEIARVAVGPTVFSGRDSAVLWAVDHVLANRRIDAETQRLLGEDVVLSIRIAAKFYETVASIMYDAEPEPDVEPISGLETPAQARGAYAALLA
jgi:AhpD family alkylhydroperoxidase